MERRQTDRRRRRAEELVRMGPTRLARHAIGLEEKVARLEQGEQKLGPMVRRCPDRDCTVLELGSGYTSCPGCGGPLEVVDDEASEA